VCGHATALTCFYTDRTHVHCIQRANDADAPLPPPNPPQTNPPGHAIGPNAALTAPALAAYLASQDDMPGHHPGDTRMPRDSDPTTMNGNGATPMTPPKAGWLRDPGH